MAVWLGWSLVAFLALLSIYILWRRRRRPVEFRRVYPVLRESGDELDRQVFTETEDLDVLDLEP